MKFKNNISLKKRLKKYNYESFEIEVCLSTICSCLKYRGYVSENLSLRVKKLERQSD